MPCQIKSSARLKLSIYSGTGNIMDTSCTTNARLGWSHSNAGILRWVSLWSQIKSTNIWLTYSLKAPFIVRVSKITQVLKCCLVCSTAHAIYKVTRSSHECTWISTSDLPFPSSFLPKVFKLMALDASWVWYQLDVSLCWVSTLARSRLTTVLFIFIHVQEIDKLNENTAIPK